MTLATKRLRQPPQTLARGLGVAVPPSEERVFVRLTGLFEFSKIGVDLTEWTTPDPDRPGASAQFAGPGRASKARRDDVVEERAFDEHCVGPVR